MSKEELIVLLKTYKENVAKLKLGEKEKKQYEIKLARLKSPYTRIIETNITSSNAINAGIRSKNTINDKIGNAVANGIDRNNAKIKELENKIIELDLTIKDLKDKVDEVEIRLNGLYYKEREILTAYYVENRTSEDISQNVYFKLFNRTCSPRYIRDVINRNTEKILKM